MNFSYFFALIALALSVVSVQAQTSLNTTPLGMIAFPLAPNATTYMSLPLEANPVYTGAVSAISTVVATTADTISVADTPSPWTAGQLTGSQPYFVKILSGAETGRIMRVTANTTNSVSLDTTDHTSQVTPIQNTPASSFDIQTGDTFEIFPAATLGSLFGTQAPLQSVVGNTNVSSADTISVFTTLLAPSPSFFFDTGRGYWRQYPSTANANNSPIYPYSTLAITRRPANGTTTVSFPVMGCVTNVALLIKTISLQTLYTSTQYPANIELSQLQLGANWTQGTSISNSDILGVYNSSEGRFDSYYQIANPVSPDSGWRKYPNKTTDAGTFVIPAGSAVYIAKQNGSNGQPVSGAASYLQPPLPYTIQPSGQ